MKKRLFVLVLALGMLMLCACGSSAYREDVAAATTEMAYSESGDYAYGWDNYAAEEVADYDMAVPEEAPAAGNNENANYLSNLKIIKTGYIDIQTEQFEGTDAMIREKVTAYQGILAESSISGTAGNRYANYTVRIPSASFDAFFYDVTNGSTVTYQNISAEDVTEYYTDISTRLNTAQKKYERLLELLDEAETLTDIYSIQSEIADVEYQIDSLTGTINGLDSRISYSTINISVDETAKVTVIPETPTFGAMLLAAFKNGTSGAIEFVQDFILFLVETWFFWLIVIIVVILIRRRIVRKRRENPKEKKEKNRKKEREGALKTFRNKMKKEKTPEQTLVSEGTEKAEGSEENPSASETVENDTEA